MDIRNRWDLDSDDSDFMECDCDDEKSSARLPWETLQAARDGDVDKIQEYIDKEQDINALYKGECLLFRACTMGHVDIVKMLLHHPSIHVNIKCRQETPLMQAARNGHIECFKLLLDSSIECNVNLNSCWKTLINVLKEQPELKPKSVHHILIWALQGGYWDVILLLLQSGHHLSEEHLNPIVYKAINHNRFDVIYSVLGRDFYGKNKLIIDMFIKAVHVRCWERVENFAHMITEDLRIDVPFVESALTGRINEVKRLFTENQYDSQILNGTLLVVAAGGTSEEVAEFLMTMKNTYTKMTLSNALSIAAMVHSTEMFIHLLSNPEASYSASVLCQVKGSLNQFLSQQVRGSGLEKLFNIYLENKMGL